MISRPMSEYAKCLLNVSLVVPTNDGSDETKEGEFNSLGNAVGSRTQWRTSKDTEYKVKRCKSLLKVV